MYPLYPYTTPYNTRATASHAMPMGALVGSMHRRWWWCEIQPLHLFPARTALFGLEERRMMKIGERR